MDVPTNVYVTAQAIFVDDERRRHLEAVGAFEAGESDDVDAAL